MFQVGQPREARWRTGFESPPQPLIGTGPLDSSSSIFPWPALAAGKFPSNRTLLSWPAPRRWSGGGPCPWRPDVEPAWQLRGMATSDAARGRGVGRLALDAAVEHVRATGAALLWCNARDVALSFYERAGFAIEGDGFVNDHGIPHHPMGLDLD